MSDRILTTEAAREAVRQLQQLLNGGLVDQMELLNRQGQVLSDPNLWDGNLAQQFRYEWPQHQQALRRTQETFQQLRMLVERAQQNMALTGGD
jgi:hypothetical protein